MRQIRTHKDIKQGLRELLRIDPQLMPIAETAGEVPLRLSTPDFGGLAAIVISQQVSRASAEAIHGRLAVLVEPLNAPGILTASDDVFREAGLSRSKQRTLLAIAQTIADGRLDLAALCRMDADQAMAELTAIKGIGPWTAEIYLMFCAGHCDVFPAGDLALQEAVRAAFALDERPDHKELRLLAAKWQPWRSVAARLFWAYYSSLRAGKDAMPL
jgi:DNA-3-methyladenine glycosylase II